MYWCELLYPERKRQQASVGKTVNDRRSPFKKDFDTICNSNALRRLQDKAQVFPLEEGDYTRTRLTHSIEVLSVVESLGIGLRDIVRDPLNSGYLCRGDVNQDVSLEEHIENIPVILKCAALLHDMGNPPFGHLTEQVISDWFKGNLSHYEYLEASGVYVYSENPRNNLWVDLSAIGEGDYLQDLLHFDGNAQLLRLVTKLNLVVDDNGMNLTYPVIASFIKYPCGSTSIDKSQLAKKKAGYFVSERDIFEEIASKLGLGNSGCYHRHPLAFLLEAADDIAYLTADIEDAHHKGIVSVQDVENYITEYDEGSDLVRKIQKEIKRYRVEAEERKLPRADGYVMHRLRILLKGEMISAVESVLSDRYVDIMEGRCNEELLSVSKVAPIVKAIRKLEEDRIYYCRNIIESKTRAAVIVRKLLDSYVLAALNYQRDNDYNKDTSYNYIYESLSPNFRYVCERQLESETDRRLVAYQKLRLVVDQIAGMTDSRALSDYKVLTAS